MTENAKTSGPYFPLRFLSSSLSLVVRRDVKVRPLLTSRRNSTWSIMLDIREQGVHVDFSFIVTQNVWSFATFLFFLSVFIDLLSWVQALNILKSLSKKVIRKLGMDEHLARPESLIMNALPLPPSGSRIVEMDMGTAIPRTLTVGWHCFTSILCRTFTGFRRSSNSHNCEHSVGASVLMRCFETYKKSCYQAFEWFVRHVLQFSELFSEARRIRL